MTKKTAKKKPVKKQPVTKKTVKKTTNNKNTKTTPKKKAAKKSLKKKTVERTTIDNNGPILLEKAKSPKIEPVRAKNINLFHDDRKQIELYYASNPTEKNMYTQRPSQRKRAPTTVKTQCIGCHKTFEVSKILLHPIDNTYKCNACIIGRR